MKRQSVPHNDSAGPLLTVERLSVSFRTGEGGIFQAVRDVSFTLNAGETLAVVGESGSGKSVTALSILGLLAKNAQYGTDSTVRLSGGDSLIGAGETALRQVRGNRIAMIFQEPMTSLNPLHTIGRQIEESLSIHTRLDLAARKARVLDLLNRVGLEALMGRLGAYPHELSGGQRQRVMIAMALACDPDILIADEPTTALDVTVQAQILDLLKDIQKRSGMGIILITHDLTIVRRMADRVCVMRGGQMVETGAAGRILDAPDHPYTRMLVDAVPSGKAAARTPKGSDDPILSVEGVHVRFPVRKNFWGRAIETVHAVNDVYLSVRNGETLGIVGESGSGKSTLGFSILRLLKPEGRIVFAGRDIAALPERSIRPYRAAMQIVFQDPFGSLSPRMTAGDIIAEGLGVHHPRMTKDEKNAAVIEAMGKVRLDPDTRHRFPHEFSGGQRQRIAIARALVLKPRLVILDEPTSALDMSVQAEVVGLMRTLQREDGLSYIFISHDLRVVRALSHRVIVMKDGRIVEQGETADIFDNPQQDYTRNLIKAAFGNGLSPAETG